MEEVLDKVELNRRALEHRIEFQQRYNQRASAGVFGKIKAEDRLGGGGFYRTLFAWSYDGEKNLGELGPPKDYRINYRVLSMRSWQAFADSEVAQIVLGRHTTWVIGKGLRIQSEPSESVLQMEGIKVNAHDFSEIVEERFHVHANSRRSAYTQMSNLNLLQAECHKNSIVGGDALVLLRYDGKAMTVQVLDGVHVVSPLYGSEFYPMAVGNSNRIEDGIELSPSNEHVAYYVRTANVNGLYNYQTVRIPAKTAGTVTAFMVYGSKYRIDNHRGMPLLSVVLETMKKLERYKEAAVGSAEERQKIAYFIQHDLMSTGENPLLKATAIARDLDMGSGDVPVTAQGDALAERVAATTNKQVFNLPQGSEMKAMATKSEMYFKDFFSVNIDMICAAAEIPPDVAMSKYNNSYSASRAAIKDWEHTLDVKRYNFAFQFMQPIYNFWLTLQVLSGKIIAPGYLKAIVEDNYMAVEAYQKARFVGAAVPHIDPEKEVNAQRLMLGEAGAAIPLTTAEAATQALNAGDSEANRTQFAEELAESKKLKIEIPMPQQALSGGQKKKPKPSQ